MKTFIAIMLALTLLACDPDDSSSEPKQPDPISTCAITQFQDETGKTQAIVAGKEGKGQDIEKGQTLKLFYDCGIAQKDYGKTAKLAVSDTTAIQASVTEIKLPDQAKTTGSFTVTGLKTANTNVQTSIKIKLEKSDVLTQLALTVTPTFVLNPKKVKIEIVYTLTALTDRVKKLEVYQDKFYLLNATGGSSDDVAKLYTSPDGKTWKYEGEPTVDGKNIVDSQFDTAVHDDKLWVAGSHETSLNSTIWSFDGTNWKRFEYRKIMRDYGSMVSFQNILYQIGGKVKIWAYDGSQWTDKHTFPNRFGRIDAVVFDGKIWIVGGEQYPLAGRDPLKTVATFDGTTYQKVANLPKDSWWAAVEVFPRGLLAIGGLETNRPVPAVFYSRFGKNWTEITGIKKQSELQEVFSGGTVVWKDALWAVNDSKKILKITYDK